VIPNQIGFIGAISGALIQLTRSWHWEEQGDMTAEETAEAMQSVILDCINSEGWSMLGSIFPYATVNPPAHCLPCDGATYNRVDYPRLYAQLHPNFILDANHFKTPAMPGSFPFGASLNPLTGYQPGDLFGSDEISPTIAELPAHAHTSAAHHHSYTKPVSSGLYSVAAGAGGTLTIAESGNGAGAIGNSSGNNSELAMSFIPFAGQLTQIRVGHNVNVGTPSGTVAWRICADGSGAPGAILASGTYTPVASSQNIINVSGGPYFNGTATFWLWLRPSTPQSTNVRWSVNHNTTSYASGVYKQTTNAGSNWSTISGFWMDIVITSASTGPASDYPILTTESNTTADATDTMSDTGSGDPILYLPPGIALKWAIVAE
jgi:microcystin-dependent protein